MKVVIAQMWHETNVYSPVPTPLACFASQAEGWSDDGGRAAHAAHLTPPPDLAPAPLPLQGGDAYQACKGGATAIAAFIELAEEAGAQIVLPLAARAGSSGPVEDAAFEHMAGRIVAAVAEGCDAVLLDLHGAMVTPTHADAEGELLRRLRAVAPQLPVGVALDLHANVSQTLAGHATVIAGPHDGPRTDAFETGLRVGRAIFAHQAGRRLARVAWGRRPMLPHALYPLQRSSHGGPGLALQARCRELELQGALAASVFTGFAQADVSHAGLSAAVVTDGDPDRARQWCDELLDLAWSQRESFNQRPEPLADALARAQRLRQGRHEGDGPVLLLDYTDSGAGGGSMDTMAVLGAILDAGLQDVAALPVCDPGAVQQMMHAGVGAQMHLWLGGKTHFPALDEPGTPRSVQGHVRLLCDGSVRGPLGQAGLSMGLTAVLDTGRVEIVVTSRRVEAVDLDLFHSVGINPLHKRYLMLKAGVDRLDTLSPACAAVVACVGDGVSALEYAALPFRHLRRPIYPLDPI